MFSDNSLIDSAVEGLGKRLPPGWRIKQAARGRQTGKGDAPDTVLQISGPGSGIASVIIEAKSRLEPKDVDGLTALPRADDATPLLVVAPFLSPRTRQCLEAAGLSYFPAQN